MCTIYTGPNLSRHCLGGTSAIVCLGEAAPPDRRFLPEVTLPAGLEVFLESFERLDFMLGPIHRYYSHPDYAREAMVPTKIAPSTYRRPQFFTPWRAAPPYTKTSILRPEETFTRQKKKTLRPPTYLQHALVPNWPATPPPFVTSPSS